MTAQHHRVVVTQRFFDDESVAYLRANGCEVHIADLPAGVADSDLAPEALKELLNEASGWIVGHARVTRELLAALPDLQVISRRGVGYERVDLEAARDLGRVVAIAAGGNDASVADHVIGLMLAVARRFRESQALLEAGTWKILQGSDLYGKTVGVIGLGRIGRSVVKRLEGFETEVLTVSGRADPDYIRSAGVTETSLDAVLARADFISLHAPLNAQTRFMIDASALARMKPGAVLINTARGGLVDDRALLDALRHGRIAGAGLDVFMSENDPDYASVTADLVALPNVVATPHAGASSVEGLNRTNRVAAESVVAVLTGGEPNPACIVADGRPGDA